MRIGKGHDILGERDCAYDAAGNIETVSRDGVPLTKYHYDGLNRLVREDNYLSAEAYTWTYDVGGNITEKKTYTLSGDINLGQVKSTASYTYGNTVWKDQLTAYNGQTITYDALGNPTEYKGNELDWTRMRQLASYGSNTFEYGADGIRCKKNNITYALNGSRILRENRGAVSLTYYYGLSGIIGFQYDDEDYFYQKNLQGDITAIYNSYGALVAEYKYDAWGKVLAVVNHTSANIGTINPFRYRGYYYDTETGLYYLQSRYYDPETGRFINADDLAYLGADQSLSGYNLYVYCATYAYNTNNPPACRAPSVTSFRKWTFGNDIAKLADDIIYNICYEIVACFKDIYNLFKNFITNDDPMAVRRNLSANKISFYKGALVLPLDLPGRGTAFSFGIIGIDPYNIPKSDTEFIQLVNHEYGHCLHMMQIGLMDYFITTAIPSLICAAFSDNQKPGLPKWLSDNYYNLPWERIAEHLGGVDDRTHSPESNTIGALYWIFTIIYSILTPY